MSDFVDAPIISRVPPEIFSQIIEYLKMSEKWTVENPEDDCRTLKKSEPEDTDSDAYKNDYQDDDKSKTNNSQENSEEDSEDDSQDEDYYPSSESDFEDDSSSNSEDNYDLESDDYKLSEDKPDEEESNNENSTEDGSSEASDEDGSSDSDNESEIGSAGKKEATRASSDHRDSDHDDSQDGDSEQSESNENGSGEESEESENEDIYEDDDSEVEDPEKERLEKQAFEELELTEFEGEETSKEEMEAQKSGIYNLSHYSAVSWQFRNAIERENFRSLTLNSSSFESFQQALRNLKLIMRQASRSSYLRQLNISIFLPDYPVELPHKRRSVRRARESWDDKHFTKIIKSIMVILSEWQTNNIILLRIPRITSSHFETQRGKYSSEDYLGRRPMQLSLLNVPIGPKVDCIRQLMILCNHDCYREMEAASAFRIARNFPNLEALKVITPDRRFLNNSRRCARRNKLASELSLLPETLPRLEDLHFSYMCNDARDQTFNAVSVLEKGTDQDFDPVGVAMQGLYNCSLIRIQLKGPLTFSDDFFISNSRIEEKLFSNLKSLSMKISLIEASGDWLIEGEPDLQERKLSYGEDFPGFAPYYDSESEYSPLEDNSEDESIIESRYYVKMGHWPKYPFRWDPSFERWKTIVMKMARMARMMPNLQSFRVYSDIAREEDYFSSLILHYLAPGVPRRFGPKEPEEYLIRKRLYCSPYLTPIIKKAARTWIWTESPFYDQNVNSMFFFELRESHRYRPSRYPSH